MYFIRVTVNCSKVCLNEVAKYVISVSFFSMLHVSDVLTPHFLTEKFTELISVDVVITTELYAVYSGL